MSDRYAWTERTENRLTAGGTFGPVFASGVGPDNSFGVTEGIVEFCLVRHNAVLMVEMTVDAANKLADDLLVTTGRAIPPNPQEGETQ